MKLGLVQQRAAADPAENLKQAEEDVRGAADRGAELVVLGELFRTRYFPQHERAESFDLAESVPGPTSERMRALARELGVALVVPLFERRAAGVYHNTVLVLDADGSEAGRYRKTHVPHDPGFEEKYYFTPGEDEPRAIDTAAGRLGVAICWDQWFPEVARLLALDGATCLLYPSAIGWLPEEDAACRARQLDAWRTTLRAHAIANGVYVAATNRVGREERIEFWGSSFACDPRGEPIADASTDEPEILVVDCPTERIETQRREWPFLRDRRIDLYAPLTRRLR